LRFTNISFFNALVNKKIANIYVFPQ